MSDPVVTPLGGGRYLVDDGTTRRVAHAIATPEAAWIHLDGRVHVLHDAAATSPSSRAGRGAEDAALASPMPATVVAVHAAEGQIVLPGQVLVTLEAMKMELPIRAPRAGIVARLHCRAGDLVQAGLALVEMTPLPDSGDDRPDGR